jgi:hypothetical protein
MRLPFIRAVAYHTRSLVLYVTLGFEVREPLATLQEPPLAVPIPGYAVHQGTTTVVEHDGRLTGYAIVLGFTGHAMGESNADLEALIGAAAAFVGPGFLLPTRNGELFRWCLAHGLRVIQPMTLMSLGLYNEPRGAFLASVLY